MHCWWWIGKTRSVSREEMGFQFDLKEEYKDKCLTERKWVPEHRSSVLKGSLPQGPSAHPWNTEDASICGWVKTARLWLVGCWCSIPFTGPVFLFVCFPLPALYQSIFHLLKVLLNQTEAGNIIGWTRSRSGCCKKTQTETVIQAEA